MLDSITEDSLSSLNGSIESVDLLMTCTAREGGGEVPHLGFRTIWLLAGGDLALCINGPDS